MEQLVCGACLLQLPNCPLMCFCLVCSLSLPSVSLFRLFWVLSSHLNFYFLSFSFIMFCLHFSVCSHFHSVGCLLIIKCARGRPFMFGVMCVCPSIDGTANAFCFCWCLFISLLTVTLIGRCACPLLCFALLSYLPAKEVPLLLPSYRPVNRRWQWRKRKPWPPPPPPVTEGDTEGDWANSVTSDNGVKMMGSLLLLPVCLAGTIQFV